MAKLMIHYTLPNVWRIGSLRLYPGINEVDSKVWDKYKDHPLMKERFDTGALVWIRGGEKAAKPTAPAIVDGVEDVEDDEDALAGLTVAEANKIVVETFNLELLEKWADIETRKGVLKVIAEQVEKVTPKESDFRESEDGNIN